MPLSIDARPALLFSSSPVPSSRSTAETLLSPRSLTAATSAGLSSGTAGTYQLSLGSAFTPPATASISPFTSFLHEPQPVPARVALPTAGTVHLPVLDRRDDRALAHAVAVADLVRSRAGRRATLPSSADAGAEEQFEPAVGDGRAGLEQSASGRRPGRGRRADTRRSPSRRGRSPSSTRCRAGSLNCTTSSVGLQVGDAAHARQFDAHHLELGRDLRAGVGGGRVRAGEHLRQHLRLLPQRRDEAVDHAVVLDALADAEHGRVARAELVVHDDRPVAGDAALLRQFDVRAGCRRR